jgi:virginiamycin B lyase
VGGLDAATGVTRPCAEIAAGPCGAMEFAFGSIWTATCDSPGIARIDPKTSAVSLIPVSEPISDSEISIGASGDAIWVPAGLVAQVLVKIDPTTNAVVASYPVAIGSRAVRAGFGSIWVTNPVADTLTRLDPANGSTIATILTGDHPKFLAVGERGVWVLNGGGATVAHVDPATNRVIATISVGPPVIGDIVVGEGSVWVRTGLAADTMLVRIDPTTDRIVQRFGPGVGGGGVAVGDGAVWISSEDRATIWRLPIPAR